MTDKSQETAKLLQAALKIIEKQKEELSKNKSIPQEDIAIIGMDAKFPGGDTLDEFWEFLINKKDGISSVPNNRWDIKQYIKEDNLVDPNLSGFIKQPIEFFDANFFKMTPLEAEVLDPQQRLSLESAWNALENACVNPLSIAGKKVSIFSGCINNDFELIINENIFDRTFNHFVVTNARSGVIAGRIGYFLGTTGPTANVDTACSSSLVTLDMGCTYLQNRECDLAVASGVNVILNPNLSLIIGKSGMLSPDNHCKTFDESANGYARGEGVATIVLKRLSDAIKNNDRILAVIKNVSIGHNGASGGLTVPSGRSQAELLKNSLDKANLKPEDIDYIECHGTGTSLGDPIEVNAINAVYKGREKPILLGSIKSNIGHLESAAGVAGVTKVLLALEHEKIPPNVNFNTLNSKINLEEIPAKIVTEPITWPVGDKLRRAGISSFGYNGINAHVILEDYKPSIQDNLVTIPQGFFKISAKHPKSLQLIAEKYKEFLLHHENVSFEDFCYSANIGRADFDIREFVHGENKNELIEKLSKIVESYDENTVVKPLKKNHKIVFMFTGQGSQYTGMGKLLYDTQPLYKSIIDKCAVLLKPYLDNNLIDILFNNQVDINLTINTQPALFVLEYALAKLWMSWGVQPSYLIGHSVGEIVAATVAEVISLEDGIKLIANRAKLMQALPAGGGMAAAMMSHEKVLEIIEKNGLVLDIAGINSPTQTILAGDLVEIDKFLNIALAQELQAQKLMVSHAFHSRLMRDMFNEFSHAIDNIQYNPAKIPIVSNVTGSLCDSKTFNTQYWLSHIESPVKFLQSITALDHHNPTVYLEIGPHMILTRLGQQSLSTQASKIWLSSLQRGFNDWTMLFNSLENYYKQGGEINWEGFYSSYHYKKIAIPNYQFYRKRYWFHEEHFLVQSKKDNNISLKETTQLENEALNKNVNVQIFIKEQLANITKIPVNDIDESKEFEHYGIDSNIIVMLNGKLEEKFGKLPATLFFKYRTIEQVAEYLEKNVTLSKESSPQTNRTTQSEIKESLEKDNSIAVIGFSGQFPQAENVYEFWNNLAAGKDCIEEIPSTRWNNSLYYNPEKDTPNKYYSHWGGFIKNHDKFDAGLFNITPNVARFMTPQERLFLHSTWETFESAGYSKSHLHSLNKKNQNVGVFATTSYNDYQLYAEEEWENNNYIPINAQTFSVANRVSYYFNLSGPSLTLDTACSSSLYAIHLACESLRNGECHMAIAGGVNLTLHPSKYMTLAISRFLASDGRCHSFGEGGDGYVPGEGVGSVLLKPLSQALKDKDTIYAVIQGSAVSHDGRTNGYSVPNPVAQTQAILKALEMSKINPRSISYVEGHGTGTALGDPIEITGLTDAYETYTKDKQFCSIGSVKSNIGHLEATAGISQLIKVLLQMKNKYLVPNLTHSANTNPHIDFSQTPFKVQRTLEPWISEQKRTAGISSFGAGGTNVHLILEDYPETEVTNTVENNPRLFVLSAMSLRQLEEYCQRFLIFLKSYAPQQDFIKTYNLKDVVYTLQTGRESMDCRLAIVCNSINDLIEKLMKASTLLKNNNFYGDENIYINPSVQIYNEKTQTLDYLNDTNLSHTASDWLLGKAVDWHSLYDEKVKKLLLPTYPFELQPYWVTTNIHKKEEISVKNTVDIVPLKEIAPSQAFSSHSQYLNKLANAPEKQQLKMITETLSKITAKILGYDENTPPDMSKGFFELGIESIDIVKIQKSLEDTFQCKISDTAMFDHPTVAKFTQYILSIIPMESILNSLVKDKETAAVSIKPNIAMESVKNTSQEEDLSQIVNRLEKAIHKYGRAEP